MERKCYACRELKDLNLFVKDIAKPEGRGYICSECKNKQGRENRQKKRKMKKAKMHAKMHMMADNVFKIYYENEELSIFVRQNAVRHSKHDKMFQKDLMQIGWAHIAMCEQGKDIAYYQRIAYNAMFREYRKQYLRREYGLSDEELMSKSEYEMWRRGVY